MTATAIVLSGFAAEACTRFVYETATNSFNRRSLDGLGGGPRHRVSGLSPSGIERDGGAGPGSITWTSKHGSVIASFYNIATVDGMNDANLVANALYLAESDYGDAKASGKPLISIGAWTQYVLDNYGTVAEAVDALGKEPFAIFAPELPNGKKASGHLAIADASGDSAIFEYIDGKLVIHHDRQYTVMTNSPPFDQQLAIEPYWKGINGLNFLPGTINAADRFVRMSWMLGAAPHGEGTPARRRHRLLADPRDLGPARPRRSGEAEHRRDDLADGVRRRRGALLFRVRLQPVDLLGRPGEAQTRSRRQARQARPQRHGRSSTARSRTSSCPPSLSSSCLTERPLAGKAPIAASSSPSDGRRARTDRRAVRRWSPRGRWRLGPV